ncbi:MAG: molybdopterin molybdotransferase MoeA, partial [Pseudomonadota bacterium]
MTTGTTDAAIEFDPSCMDEYDPNSLPVDIALQRIAYDMRPIAQTERVALRSALGRILARDIKSAIDVPTHTNSAMDGYAVRSADLAGDAVLQVVGTSWAGHPHRNSVEAGQCVRIMTGAAMPPGSDSVVIQERVERTTDTIRVNAGEVSSGENVREAGEDIPAGGGVVSAGTRIGAAELGLIASVGVGEVDVVRRIRVAFFSTGDELRSIGEPLDV